MAIPQKTHFPRVGGNQWTDSFYRPFLPVGDVRYVHSSGTSTGPGFTPETAYSTLQAAHDASTASNGDHIIVLQGHAESISSAAAILISKAGLTITGLGTGSDRPTFTWHTTDATFKITGANTTLRNLLTVVDLDEVVSMFDVRAADVTFDAVDFNETTSAQAIQWLLTTTASPRLTIQNCRHKQMTAAASAQKWIQIVGPCTGCRIIDNVFQITANASTSSNLISGSTAVTEITIARNLCLFLGATITIVVNLVTGSTGIISDNRAGSGTSVATAAAFTGDGCFMFNNLWADTAAASGLLAPGVDSDT